jgi:homocitrate synthase NifV
MVADGRQETTSDTGEVGELMIMFEDSTLREGEQSPGVAFSPEEKVEIATRLAEVGVDALEVGTPAMGGPEEDAIRLLLDADLDVRLIGWNRGRLSDLEASFDCGLSAVHIGLPASDHHLEKKFEKSREWVVEVMQEMVGYAKGQGSWVSVSAEDVARADAEFLIEYAQAVKDAGADRLRLSDTIGILRPQTAKEIFANVSAVGIPLQAHMHNDYGLATANTLAAVEGGAEHVHATVNGLGERAGIAPIDELILGLQRHLDIDQGWRTECLLPLCEYVAKISGRRVASNKPVTGDAIFAHESGIHVDGVLRIPDSFEPFPPEAVGAERRIVIGKHSGSAAIQHVLASRGVEVERGGLDQVTEAVRYEAVRLKREISPEETVEIHRAVTEAENGAGRSHHG